MRLLFFISLLLFTPIPTSGFLLDPSPVDLTKAYDGVTFLLVTQSKTWQGAREYCRIRGLDLFVHDNNNPAVRGFMNDQSFLSNINRAKSWHFGGRTCDDLQRALCFSYLHDSATSRLRGKSEPDGSSLCQKKTGFLCSNSCRRTLPTHLPETTGRPPTTTTKRSNCIDVLNFSTCQTVVATLACRTVGATVCRKSCGLCDDSKVGPQATATPFVSTTLSSTSCADSSEPFCRPIVAGGTCSTFSSLCRKSCGICKGTQVTLGPMRCFRHLRIGPDDVQVGVMTYSSSAYQIKLNDYHTLIHLQSAINLLSYTAGGTPTGQAIQHMTATSFTTSYGGRVGVPKIAVIITDGASADDVYIPSNAARSQGIKIFSVGIGAQVNHAQLNAMASPPFNEHVFSVQDFAGLDSIKSAITTTFCEEALKPTTTMKLILSTTKPLTTNPVTSTLKPATSTPNPRQSTPKPPVAPTAVTITPSTGTPVPPVTNVTLVKTTMTPKNAGSKCTCRCTSTTGVNASITEFQTTPEFLSNTTTATFTTTTQSPTTVTPAPSAAATTTTPGSPGCVDTFKDCTGLGLRVCTGLTTWAQEHCAAYCGFCHLPSPCQDVKNCDRYGDTICSAAPLSAWVDDNCRKFCNRC